MSCRPCINEFHVLLPLRICAPYHLCPPPLFRVAFFSVDRIVCYYASFPPSASSKALSICTISTIPGSPSSPSTARTKAFPVPATGLFSHGIYSAESSARCSPVFRFPDSTLLAFHSVDLHRVLFCMLSIHCTRFTVRHTRTLYVLSAPCHSRYIYLWFDPV